MNHCPTCICQEPCEVDGCDIPSAYEGWWRAKDFAGFETGLIQRRRVCGLHVMLLIGKHEKEDKIARGLLLPKSKESGKNLNSEFSR